jgi:hypothetical protein
VGLLNELATFLATAGAEDSTSTGRLHASPETDLLFATPIVRLVRSFHDAE